MKFMQWHYLKSVIRKYGTEGMSAIYCFVVKVVVGTSLVVLDSCFEQHC